MRTFGQGTLLNDQYRILGRIGERSKPSSRIQPLSKTQQVGDRPYQPNCDPDTIAAVQASLEQTLRDGSKNAAPVGA
jgi:hypothetical protein